MTGTWTIKPHTLRFREPFRTANGALTERRVLLVQLHDLEGRVGVGEAAPLPPWTETYERCEAALKTAVLAPDPLAAVPDDAPAARHALSQAILDVQAQAAGVPLCTHLRADARPGAVPVNAVLGADEPPERARGYPAVKVKLTGTGDVERVRAVRETLGPDVELRLDPNASWTFDEAVARLEALARFEPAYVEQPVEGVDDLRRLRERGIVPVAADEVGPAALDADACDVLIVKPMALGGPDLAARAIERAREKNVRCVVTTLLDGPVAWHAAAHVACLLPEPRPACGLDTLRLFEVAHDPVARGRVRVPAVAPRLSEVLHGT